jgi:hypothetical protein
LTHGSAAADAVQAGDSEDEYDGDAR